MKTAQALTLAGSKIKLAALLGVTRQAIQQYGEELPPERSKILEGVKPEWFPMPKRRATDRGVS